VDGARVKTGSGKVFGIGLNKTGTRSLAAATRHLGLRTLHKGDRATSDLVDAAAEAGEPLLGRIGDRYDAYFDVDAIVRRFAELDVQFEGARFIVTTRSLDAWLDSREKHVRANQERAARGEYDGGWLVVDRDAWEAERAAHHAAVEAHFAGRDDCLWFDVGRGDAWEVLAPFLGRSVPALPFPWENRDGAGTYAPARPRRRLDGARRVVRRVGRRVSG
jgi:hypothetical protein